MVFLKSTILKNLEPIKCKKRPLKYILWSIPLKVTIDINPKIARSKLLNSHAIWYVNYTTRMIHSKHTIFLPGSFI